MIKSDAKGYYFELNNIGNEITCMCVMLRNPWS